MANSHLNKRKRKTIRRPKRVVVVSSDSEGTLSEEPQTTESCNREPNRENLVPKMARKRNTKRAPIKKKIGDDDMPKEYVSDSQIRETDIFSNRGRSAFRHPGNQRFRSIILSFIDQYERAPTRQDKSETVDEVTEKVFEYGGRFLKKDRDNNDQWYVITLKEARAKIGHTLRDCCTDRIKSMKAARDFDGSPRSGRLIADPFVDPPSSSLRAKHKRDQKAMSPKRQPQPAIVEPSPPPRKKARTSTVKSLPLPPPIENFRPPSKKDCSKRGGDVRTLGCVVGDPILTPMSASDEGLDTFVISIEDDMEPMENELPPPPPANVPSLDSDVLDLYNSIPLTDLDESLVGSFQPPRNTSKRGASHVVLSNRMRL